jgi:hypothetical protein
MNGSREIRTPNLSSVQCAKARIGISLDSETLMRKDGLGRLGFDNRNPAFRALSYPDRRRFEVKDRRLEPLDTAAYISPFPLPPSFLPTSVPRGTAHEIPRS